MDKIFVTGHRPDKLFGYNLNHPNYIQMKNEFKKILVNEKCKEGYSGMALGVDQIFAIAILELKDEGFPIKLKCIIPCINQERMWVESSKKLYKQILSLSDEIIYVTNTEYTKSCMQLRNQYMVDNADGGIVVYDGTNGCTCNCFNYIKKQKKPYYLIYIKEGRINYDSNWKIE